MLLRVISWRASEEQCPKIAFSRTPTSGPRLTSYFFLWRFVLVTVGRTSLPYLVCNNTVENSWGVNWIPREFTRNIQSFGLSLICVVCDIDETGKRALKLSSQWNTTHLWVVDFVFFSGKVLHLRLLGVLFYLTLFGIDTVENSWGVNWIHR